MILKTIIFSIILVTLSLLGLAIGLILTGKPKLKKGCGFPSDIKKKDQCEKKCEVCDPSKKDKKKF